MQFIPLSFRDVRLVGHYSQSLIHRFIPIATRGAALRNRLFYVAAASTGSLFSRRGTYSRAFVYATYILIYSIHSAFKSLYIKIEVIHFTRDLFRCFFLSVLSCLLSKTAHEVYLVNKGLNIFSDYNKNFYYTKHFINLLSSRRYDVDKIEHFATSLSIKLIQFWGFLQQIPWFKMFGKLNEVLIHSVIVYSMCQCNRDYLIFQKALKGFQIIII